MNEVSQIELLCMVVICLVLCCFGDWGQFAPQQQAWTGRVTEFGICRRKHSSRKPDCLMGSKNMPANANLKHPERKAALDALDGVQDATWFCILTSAKAINRVMADTVMDDPTPNGLLDKAIVAELSRFGDGPMPGG
jgi:hypothetical protein